MALVKEPVTKFFERAVSTKHGLSKSARIETRGTHVALLFLVPRPTELTTRTTGLAFGINIDLVDAVRAGFMGDD